MPADRGGLRGVVLTEDRCSERFFRHLLDALGFDIRKFRFRTASSGRGAAEAWVRNQYPEEVRHVRRYAAEHVGLIAVRDGDGVGSKARKRELDQLLVAEGLPVRAPNERISTPVPIWAIDNWLLYLLDHDGLTEDRGPGEGGSSWKQLFEHRHLEERAALIGAAAAWNNPPSGREELPSLADGREEVARLDS